MSAASMGPKHKMFHIVHNAIVQIPGYVTIRNIWDPDGTLWEKMELFEWNHM